MAERKKNFDGSVAGRTNTNIPLGPEITYDARFEVEGRVPRNANEVLITSHRIVSPDYLKTLGVTLMSGRFIDESDRSGSVPVVVISDELARQAWPGQDPFGKRLKRARAGGTFPAMT